MMDINKDYSEIKCPRCHTSYFEVRQNNLLELSELFTPLNYEELTNPIYKDGVLQNPATPKTTREHFKCCTCNCKFRLETSYMKISDQILPMKTIVDEDKEREDLETVRAAKKKAEEEADAAIRRQMDEDVAVGKAGRISFQPSSVITTVTNPLDDKLSDIISRLEALEKKVSSLG